MLTMAGMIVLLIVFACYWFVWRSLELPILSRLTMSKDDKVKGLDCGFISGTNDINSLVADGVTLPNEIHLTDYDKFMWIFSSYPVQRLTYSRMAGMIFLVPIDDRQANSLYLVKVPKRETSNGLKMTAEVKR